MNDNNYYEFDKNFLKGSCPNCPRCYPFVTNPMGPPGPKGEKGDQGIPGPNVSRSILPLANGSPLCIVSPCVTHKGFLTSLGFGSTNLITALACPYIDLSGKTYIATRLPYNCTIKKLTAMFVAEENSIFMCNKITLKFALYKSDTTDDRFILIPQSTMTLSPCFENRINKGDSAEKTKDVDIELSEGTRLMAVVYMEKTKSTAVTIQGNIQAGIGLEI